MVYPEIWWDDLSKCCHSCRPDMPWPPWSPYLFSGLHAPYHNAEYNLRGSHWEVHDPESKVSNDGVVVCTTSRAKAGLVGRWRQVPTAFSWKERLAEWESEEPSSGRRIQVAAGTWGSSFYRDLSLKSSDTQDYDVLRKSKLIENT